MPVKTLIAYALFGVSIVIYAAFWIWAMIHSGSTPNSKPTQRVLWVGSMIVNPSTAVWYWYIWKRWAFWLLFTPIFGVFASLPWVVRSLLTKAEATNATDLLFSLGTPQLVIVLAALMLFPLTLRLSALLHLGRNTDLSAMDRNDWVVALALPVFGFGAGFAYCAKYRRKWAIASMAYWVAISLSMKYVWDNLNQTLQAKGEQSREEFKARPAPVPPTRILR